MIEELEAGILLKEKELVSKNVEVATKHKKIQEQDEKIKMLGKVSINIDG